MEFISPESPQVSVRFERAGLAKSRAPVRRFSIELLEAVIPRLAYPAAEVSILYCSEAIIRELNRDYRSIDAPTDVLSFPAFEECPPPTTDWIHLGDLVLSPAYLSRQALDEGRSPGEELRLLLVHGLLHLIGYDHDTEETKREMWAETDRLVAMADHIPVPSIKEFG